MGLQRKILCASNFHFFLMQSFLDCVPLHFQTFGHTHNAGIDMLTKPANMIVKMMLALLDFMMSCFNFMLDVL